MSRLLVRNVLFRQVKSYVGGRALFSKCVKGKHPSSGPVPLIRVSSILLRSPKVSISHSISERAFSTDRRALADDIPPRPSRSLAGKVAIVTGAGCEEDGLGNGRAISILLAEDGASVVCADVHLSWAEYTSALIEEEGKGKAVSCQGDVTKPADCQSIVDAALSTFGRVDILVNNVGIMGARGTATNFDLDQWRRGLDVNITSMANMVKFAVPGMLQKTEALGETRGSIINIGSVAGLVGGTPHLLYPTTKGAVVNMTRAMAAHHGSDGIRVNCVCPGYLYTPMMYAKGMSAQTREERRKRSLLKTEGNAWDCATAVRFLASDQARWVTGSVITVDAGTTAVSAIEHV
ncbi:NAD(P)-binding protein [Daldinia caldariorum]|uniref:NAD(P)-binding protein n=1 Tax=Daldinia caldariorum TaxID=326644 RepID=UPI0020086ADF|nr:NAD(P)-binding protein [Daldinia caldariorum]KAI1463236.1 NAD(P)-binding protein [Daldinia caldariorum]